MSSAVLSLLCGPAGLLSAPGPKHLTADLPQGLSADSDSKLEQETLRLLWDLFLEFSGLPSRTSAPHPALQTLRRVTEGAVEKHGPAYHGMVKRLCLEDQGDSMEFISSVAQSMFSDGITNWGRVASLVAFGAVVCERLKEMGRGRCVENVAERISSYLCTDQRQWLLSNKAWDGFVEFFQVDDPESKVRNTLMAFVGFAGLGAGLVLLMR